MRTITAIMGDGIGPEVMESAMRVIGATGVEIKWERVYAGTTALEKYGNPLPAGTLSSIDKNRVALKGPCNTPTGDGFKSVNVRLRQQFDLYANIRPIKSLPGVRSRFENVDLVLFRENTEELYTGEEEYIWDSGTREIIGAKVVGRVTIAGSIRFFNRVLGYAKKNLRRRVTIGHKGNILKLIHGEMFLDQGLKFKEDFQEAGINLDSMIVDALGMWLVMDPTKFDLIAVPNLPGDFLSDVCAGLIGGLGLAPGANIGDEYAIFEAVHGTWPQAAGKNLANPTALILSAAMMLDHIGEEKAAKRIRWAIESVIAEGKKVTCDLSSGGIGVGTTDMTQAIIERIEESFDIEAESCA